MVLPTGWGKGPAARRQQNNLRFPLLNESTSKSQLNKSQGYITILAKHMYIGQQPNDTTGLPKHLHCCKQAQAL